MKNIKRSLLRIAQAFFEPIVCGRMRSARDEDKRIFIDRSGKLFEHILQFLRTRVRPAQVVLDTCAEELLLESEFYGIDWLTHHLTGEISPYDLRAEDRELLRKEHDAQADPRAFERHLLLDLNSVDLTQKCRDDLQLPLLFARDPPEAVPPRTHQQVYEQLDTFSGGLLGDLRRIQGIVIAGGSVLKALVGGGAGDLDVFLVGAEDPERALKQVYEAVQINQARRLGSNKSKMLVRAAAPAQIG